MEDHHHHQQLLKNSGIINDITKLNDEYRERLQRLVKDANKYAAEGNKVAHKERLARIDVLVTVIKDLEDLIGK